MRGVLMLISLIVVGGCVASHQSVVTDIDVRGWSDTECIVMNNSDTSTLRDIELFARYSPSLVDDSVTLSINTISPDSTTYSEELKIYFDSSMNERSASKMGIYPYRRRVVWRQLGSYQIEITPSAHVKGIEAMGINIVKTTQ